MGMGRAGPLEIDRVHPVHDEAVGVPEHRPGEHDHLVDDAAVRPVQADELVRVDGPRRFVQGIDEIDADPFDVHDEFTSFSVRLL
jgi:hypothetical protein